MIGGLFKTTSLAAIAAATVAITGSMTPAKAADLGGNCCADLEERIAELEATTVRKGNRKVSVTLSGFVSHHVMWWDDGDRNDVYIGDGGNYGSRFRFVGTAKISPTLTAGFLYEFGANVNAIGSMNQANGGDDLGASGNINENGSTTGRSCSQAGTTGQTLGCVGMRDTTVWLRHSQLGMVKVGHGSTATDNLILIDLGGMSGAASPDAPLYSGGFLIRQPSSAGAPYNSNINWNNAMIGGLTYDTPRRNHILYETPALHGFTLQAALAEDNYWDVALRYAGEHHGFRLAFGIGYQEDTEFNSPQWSGASNTLDGIDCRVILPGTAASPAARGADCNRKETELKGSISALHVATGLFATFAAGKREVEDATNVLAGNENHDETWWWLGAGLRRNVTGFGDTVFYGEYGQFNDGLRRLSSTSNVGPQTANGANNCPGAVAPNFVATCPSVSSSEATIWGLGVVQYIDAAAMELFLSYKNYSGEATIAGDTFHGKDLDLVIGGARVSF